jgi:predicted MFS family arabinose efflux permease
MAGAAPLLSSSPSMSAETGAAQGSWACIVLIYAIGVLSATTIGQVIPVIGEIARTFHAGPAAGWIISIPSLLVAVAAVLAGWLVDRWGDKAVLLGGSAIIIAGDLGAAQAGSLQWLMAWRVVEGVGYFCISVSALSLLARTTSGRRRNSALTLWSSYIPMSFALPFLLASQLQGPGRWRWAFYGHAIALGVLFCVAVLQLPRGRSADSGSRAAGLATVLRTPGPYVLGLAFASTAFMQTGILSVLPRLLTSRYGVGIGVAASIGTLGMMFKAAGCLAGGPLLNHGIRPLAIATVGVLLAISGGVAIGLSLPSFAVAVAVSSIFFLGAGLIVGLWALVPTVAPSTQCLGAASSVVTQVAIWGVLLGPPAAFAAQAHGGWIMDAAGIVLACSLILLCIWLVTKKFTGTPTETLARP